MCGYAFFLQKVKTQPEAGVLGIPQAKQLEKQAIRRMQLPKSMLGSEPAWLADTCCHACNRIFPECLQTSRRMPLGARDGRD